MVRSPPPTAARRELPGPAGPRLVIAGRSVPVVGPSRRDPRLRLSAVIIALQVLGQAVLGFKVSIAQILVTIGLCALIDTAITLGRQRILAWPASALLTGNSIAFILRASGTRHGDWWSLHGIGYFVLAAVICAAEERGPPGGVIASTPRTSAWCGCCSSSAPFTCSRNTCGGGRLAPRWVKVVASPEFLIFVCFMMSDPITAPRARSARVIYGAATACSRQR